MVLQSLSRWKRPLLHTRNPPLGEKLSVPIKCDHYPEDMRAILNVSLTNPCVDLNDLESTCVNPYEINPLDCFGQISDEQEKLGEPQQSPHKKSRSSSIKVKMEEFADLDQFLSGEDASLDIPTSIDELNTPIFERRQPFDFAVYENTYSESSAHKAEDAFTLNNSKNNTMDNNNVPLIVSSDFQNISPILSIEEYNINNNNDNININILTEKRTNAIISTPDNNNYCNQNVFVLDEEYIMQQNALASFIAEDSNTIISGSVYSTENQNSPNNNTGKMEEVENVKNEESNGSQITLNATTPAALKFNFNFFEDNSDLNTPDVIDMIVKSEDSFNIQQLVEQDNSTVNFDIIDEIDTTNSNPSMMELEEVSQEKSRKRSRRNYEDDDEDYVPYAPAKRSQKRKKTTTLALDLDAFGEPKLGDDLTNFKSEPSRRSSVSSVKSDVSKYRDLRDKNNEASRKSRLKRKMKEQSLEDEAEILWKKNIKLRAKAEQLENTVKNFRQNLFKIMLNK